jgi:hypothetical protein
MNIALKNIIYNCKQATFLIEKRSLGKITAAEAFQLQVHLRGCSVCKIYQRQSLLINRLFIDFPTTMLKLDDSFKSSLQEQIKTEMNKN